VVLRTVWPHFTPAAAAVVVGVFGTTISPYLFFWQASEEVEDMHAGRGATVPLVRDARAFTASRPLIILGWLATAVMGAAAVWMFIPN
jgi:Mn2+/Fe2+ NRAMP family transporter